VVARIGRCAVRAGSIHLLETRDHVARLEDVFGLLDEKARGKRCEGVAGILEEGKAILEDAFDRPSTTR
jgi:ferritin-like metal-binding protein YciE